MNLDLTGKTAIVCGSTQGLGYASAVELALMGCTVVLLARNEEKLQEAVALRLEDIRLRRNPSIAPVV